MSFRCSFFTQLDTLVKQIVTKLDETESDYKKELESMLRASAVHAKTVKNCVSHRMRAVAQHNKLSTEIRCFTNERCGFWFDHEQKVQPKRCEELQVEYFGKRGMSLL